MNARLRLLTLITAAATVISLVIVPITAAGAASPWSPVGIWKGTYTCSQGVTDLTLTIAHNPNKKPSLIALFDFSADPSNPGVPSGSFNMEGTYSSAGVVLTANNDSDWVNQPPGYETVDLRSGPPTDGGRSLSGSVTPSDGGSGCTTFSVQIQDQQFNAAACAKTPSNPFSSDPWMGSLSTRKAFWNTINNTLNPCAIMELTPEEFFHEYIIKIWEEIPITPLLGIFGAVGEWIAHILENVLPAMRIYELVHQAWQQTQLNVGRGLSVDQSIPASGCGHRCSGLQRKAPGATSLRVTHACRQELKALVRGNQRREHAGQATTSCAASCR
jgi:hypothetical protein